MEETYHHGNLDTELINAGIRMISRDGFAAFSLRKLSQELGVSHAAAYRHFSSKEALLGAILEETSRRVNQALCESVPPDAAGEEALMQLGVAYVMFFVEHPEILTLFAMVPAAEPLLAGLYKDSAKGKKHLRHNRFPAGKKHDPADHSEDESFQLFSRIALGLKDDPSYEHLSENEILLGFWGKVHGIASILVSQKEFIPKGKIQAAVDRVCRAKF